VPPMAHAPKLMADTFQPVRPNSRYSMSHSPFLNLDKPEPNQV
jgi:hypothetical protein